MSVETIAVEVFLDDRNVVSRLYRGKFESMQDIVDYASYLLSKKDIEPPLAYRIKKWNGEPFNMYTDIDAVDEIENSDRIGVFAEKMQEVVVEEEVIEEAVDEMFGMEQEAPEQQSSRAPPTPPSSATPPASASESSSVSTLASLGYTWQSVTKKSRPFLFKDDQAFDMEEVLNEKNEKDAILLLFTEQQYLTPKFTKAKNMLIHTCADYLIRWAKQTRKDRPKPIDVGRMAFSIWLRFQWYGSEDNSETDRSLPFAKIYDPDEYSGSLEYKIGRKLGKVKRQLAEARSLTQPGDVKKPKTGAQQAQQLMSKEDQAAAFLTLKLEAPDSKKAVDVTLQLQELRREWIHSDKSVTAEAIMIKYPTLMKKPELILCDFEADIRSKGKPSPNVAQIWSETIDFILAESISRNPKPKLQENILETFIGNGLQGTSQLLSEEKSRLALVMLPCLLNPAVQGGKGSKRTDKTPLNQALNHLIQFQQLGPGQSVSDLIAQCKKDTDLTQPFLLALSPNPNTAYCDDPSQMFLVVNFRAIEIPENSTGKALAYLFASFYTFNTSWPKGLVAVYKFLSKVFGLAVPSPGSRVLELHDKLVAYTKRSVA